uniref:MMPL family transporter n=1 Tax=Streptomyces neyagawaensis TaxID=42238 RepID=UPI000B3048F0
MLRWPRQELTAGAEPGEAGRKALDAAGRTVFFAGCTVIIALLGLVALGLGSLRGVALALALTVLTTMGASLVLLPALPAFFGRRIQRHVLRHATKNEDRVAQPRHPAYGEVKSSPGKGGSGAAGPV